MKPSHAANDNHIGLQTARTRQVWQPRFERGHHAAGQGEVFLDRVLDLHPRLGRDLTDEDARQITLNVTGFFGILAEWTRAEKFAADNDAVAPATPNNGEVCHES